MNDRELLKLAAKAAGKKIDFIESSNGLVTVVAEHEYPDKHCTDGYLWNPLDDDGDALRLAGEMGTCIVFHEDSCLVGVEHSRHGVIAFEAMDDAGTRRAIVRAVAAIGEAMP